MKILVTGASGLLGGGVARALAERGDSVTVLQRRPAGLGLPEVLADVADAAAVRQAVTGHDAVVHLAAKVNVVGPWSQYQRANVDGTRAVLDACRSAGVSRLVHVSSPAVAHGGSALFGVGAEPADPIRARGPYARSKALAEQLALAADRDDLAVLAVRPHLVWGPGDTQLVARIVDRGRRGRLPVIGSGAALVDSTYVTNAVEALVAAVDRCGEVHGRALVVSNGEPRPISELLVGFCAAAGVSGPRWRLPVSLALAAGTVVEAGWEVAQRRGDGRDGADPPITRFVAEQMATAHWFDQRDTRRLLDWRPRVSLEQGFTELARWYRSDHVSVSAEPDKGSVRSGHHRPNTTIERTFVSTVSSTIDVDVDVSTAYNQWTQFESFPSFMDGVESITQQGPTHTHWVVKVGGVKREFDTEITEQTPDRVIAWRSTGGDTDGHTGRVTFEPLGATSTRVVIELGWEPEGVVEKTGAALNFDQRQVDASAKDFKEFIEKRGGQETGAWRGNV